MEHTCLFPLVRRRLQALLNGYIQSGMLSDGIESYVVPARLGNRPGVQGALVLAENAASGRDT